MPTREVTPDTDIQAQPGEVCVFLAGTIDLGASEDWQRSFIDYLDTLSTTHITVLNPRRDTWTGTPTMDNPEFVKQVNWELDALERADVIVMRLLGTSKSPVSLLELGLHARSGKLVVHCDADFYRIGNVSVVCERYGITRVGSYDALLVEVLDRIGA